MENPNNVDDIDEILPDWADLIEDLEEDLFVADILADWATVLQAAENQAMATRFKTTARTEAEIAGLCAVIRKEDRAGLDGPVVEKL